MARLYFLTEAIDNMNEKDERKTRGFGDGSSRHVFDIRM